MIALLETVCVLFVLLVLAQVFVKMGIDGYFEIKKRMKDEKNQY